MTADRFISYGDEWDEWRPDWKDESQYEFCDRLTAEGWAWQFVRRNHEYQLYWVTEEMLCEGAIDADPAPKFQETENGIRFERGISVEECAREWGFHPPFNPCLDDVEAEFLVERASPVLEPGTVSTLDEFMSRQAELT